MNHSDGNFKIPYLGKIIQSSDMSATNEHLISRVGNSMWDIFTRPKQFQIKDLSRIRFSPICATYYSV